MDSFGAQLKFWRTLRGYSQMNLAHELGMSPRNLSFLETGRSRPTLATVNQLAKFLNITCLGREQMLLMAGLKHETDEERPDAEKLRPFYLAVKVMLAKHNPYPALVFNRWWDLVDTNFSAQQILPDVRIGDNLIEKCLLNDSWMASVLNRDEVRWSFYRELHSDLLSFHDERFRHLFAGVERCVAGLDDVALDSNPAVRFSYKAGDDVLNFTSMMTRFRSPSETRIAELKVELFFPTDASTDAFMRKLQRAAADDADR